MGLLNYFLGFEVGPHMEGVTSHLPDGVSLTQRKFTQDLLKESSYLHARPTATSLPIICKLLADSSVCSEDPIVHMTYIGKLNFLSNSRPDISFAVQTLSQFIQQPIFSHMVALDHLLRYLSKP